jgi:hypothetical protein
VSANLTTPSDGSDLNLLDLELLHNFCTLTYTTLSSNAMLRNFWKFTCIRLGVSCDYVMRSILAVSALHMAHHRHDKRDVLLNAAVMYHRLASRAAMSLMNNIPPEAREQLWIFSILTVYFGLGSPRPQDSSLLLGDSAFPDWLFLLRGVRQLHIELLSPTYDGPLSPLLTQGSARYEASHTAEHLRSHLLRDLQGQINATVTDVAFLTIYNGAIDELRVQLSFCLSQDQQSLDLMDAFVWQIGQADDFLPLLRQPTQEAAAIMAHFCVMLKCFESHWWLQGWATALITKVWGVLDSAHRPWVQWAVEEVGWVPP